jgi:hypothetical protein
VRRWELLDEAVLEWPAVAVRLGDAVSEWPAVAVGLGEAAVLEWPAVAVGLGEAAVLEWPAVAVMEGLTETVLRPPLSDHVPLRWSLRVRLEVWLALAA